MDAYAMSILNQVHRTRMMYALMKLGLEPKLWPYWPRDKVISTSEMTNRHLSRFYL